MVALQAEAARLAQRPDLSDDDRARILTDRCSRYNRDGAVVPTYLIATR